MAKAKSLKDDDVKDAMQSVEHNIELPERNKSKKVMIIIIVLLVLVAAGEGIFGYFKIKNDNKQISDLNAQVADLQNKKSALEDAAKAAAKSAANTAIQAATSNYLEVKELGFKMPLSDDIKDLQYFVNDKTAFFSSKSLQAAAWPAAGSDSAKFCSIGSLPLGTITKFPNSNDAGPTQQKSLSGFVLGYAPPQSTCSAGQSAINIQNAQKASLVSAFNKAEKI